MPHLLRPDHSRQPLSVAVKKTFSIVLFEG
jgi:hypothetical protein